jgi:UDP-N-acetylglucosamine 1-carboxyvinyltransferase
MSEDYLSRIGNLIRDARKHRGWTQSQLADVLATSQSAVNRIERGHQNLSLEMLARIGEALDSEIVSLGVPGPCTCASGAAPACPAPST